MIYIDQAIGYLNQHWWDYIIIEFVGFWLTLQIFIIKGLWQKSSPQDHACWDDSVSIIIVCIFWPISLILYLIYITSYITSRPSYIIHDYFHKYKCVKCNNRVPFNCCFCPRCGNKK